VWLTVAPGAVAVPVTGGVPTTLDEVPATAVG